jgi:hypothetical protein
MKNYKLRFNLLAATVGVLLLCAGCTKDFGTINTNPSNVTTPDPKFLFTGLNSLVKAMDFSPRL